MGIPGMANPGMMTQMPGMPGMPGGSMGMGGMAGMGQRTQVTHPYDVSQMGMIPRPASVNPYFPSSSPYSEIGFGMQMPMGEFGFGNTKKQQK
mmetsp:Transcript_491/g.790  ORF Transcript_491/g.790 Transcript_491/m.790 type:complete len:93 (+) Transcript_491:892-1170(+)